MPLLQSIEDKQFAANVKQLTRNIAEMTECVKKNNELLEKQNVLMEQLLSELPASKTKLGGGMG